MYPLTLDFMLDQLHYFYVITCSFFTQRAFFSLRSVRLDVFGSSFSLTGLLAVKELTKK